MGGKTRKTGRNAAVVGGVALLLVVVGAAASPLANGGSVKVASSKDMGAGVLNADGIKDLAFTVTGKLSDVKLSFDGQQVDGTKDGNSLVYKPTNMADGKHTFTASSKGRFGRNASTTKSFSVDTKAPVVNVDKAPDDLDPAKAYTLTGTVDDAKTLKVDDKDVSLNGGKFSVNYEHAPESAHVVATDAAGNVTDQTVSVAVSYPSMRAVHMTGLAWAYKPLHDPVIQMLKDHKIDTIELDIKDEDGAVFYKSGVALANESGATASTPVDLAAAVKEVHDLGGKLVGRIVAFRDPVLAKWAFKNGHPAYGVQDKSGNPYSAGSYGAASFTNFANPDVRQYNIDLAVEAAKTGFDSIMYDYIRRPEAHAASGGLPGQVFPGLGNTDPQDGIADFLAQAEPAVHAAGAKLGAAVFGISSFTPSSVAQNIPKMAAHLDFISPMVYPSHWGPNEYSVGPNPNAVPYDIVHRSLMDFNRQVLGTKCVIIPWLQDFTLGHPAYGAPEVEAQIKAAHDDGINSFLLWNATAKYTPDALPAKEPFSSDLPGQYVYSDNRPGNKSDGTTDAAKAEAYMKAYTAWADGGRVGTFVDPNDPTAASNSSGDTGSTPASPAPGQSDSSTPATSEPTSSPSASPKATP
ncbi:MAG TPA: putative glycoside hydrolase [Sporichthyaceae bacterium]|jgi:hypothetical protein